jgi:hypothetical protein
MTDIRLFQTAEELIDDTIEDLSNLITIEAEEAEDIKHILGALYNTAFIKGAHTVS